MNLAGIWKENGRIGEVRERTNIYKLTKIDETRREESEAKETPVIPLLLIKEHH